MTPAPFKLSQRLQQRHQDQLHRRRRLLGSPQQPKQTIDGQPVLSFCSNDYLGLANHPKVQEALIQGVKEHGVGAGASHLVNGHHHQHHLLEEELAEFTGYDRCLLFSTGYMANLGAVNGLVAKGDRVLEDKLNPASLLDAGLASGAEFARYRHLDLEHLKEKLHQGGDRDQLVVTDGIFSMDGDQAPLGRMANVCREHQAWLMVDDAHGFGTCGPQGRGSVAAAELGQQDVQLLVGTLGKAFGTFGAFVAGSDETIEALIQFSRTYIYTTALPPAVATATRMSLKLLQSMDEQRQHLRQLQNRFKAECARMGFTLWPSDSPIQPLMIGDEERALTLSERLFDQGLLVTAIRPPTVPKNTARLRVTFSADHSVEDLDRLLDCLWQNRQLLLANDSRPDDES